MLLKEWDELPSDMKNDDVKYYYDILSSKRFGLAIKRVFDIFASLVMLIILLPLFIVIALMIKADSKGPVFFRQERVTQYGRIFRIFKFRTMVSGADKIGAQVTVDGDARITKVGQKLRHVRLDEIPQLINILIGDMSFVGTRPEVLRYVAKYTDEMNATLLMPAGVTSLASIKFKDENSLLNNTDDVDRVYIEEVMPQKMKYNLDYIKDYNFILDIKIMFKTFFAVLK